LLPGGDNFVGKIHAVFDDGGIKYMPPTVVPTSRFFSGAERNA
jgi:hypothetical protein